MRSRPDASNVVNEINFLEEVAIDTITTKQVKDLGERCDRSSD